MQAHRAPRERRAPAEQPTAGAFDEPADPHHKSWKDLARAKTDGKMDKPSSTFSSWSAFGALVIVVGLILVLARVSRRHAPNFPAVAPAGRAGNPRSTPVDPRQSILLVRIGSRILVVGSSASGLNSLGQIDDAVEVDVLAGLCRRGPQAGFWARRSSDC